MTKKMIGVFTAILTALVLVGVAWADTDDGTSASISADSSVGAAAAVTSEDTSPSMSVLGVESSTPIGVEASTAVTVDDGNRRDDRATTSTTVVASTSTSNPGSSTSTTSRSTTSTTSRSTTSTSDDKDARSPIPDGITFHTIPGVGAVTIETSAGQLILVAVSAPGWDVERQKVESDRIELGFSNDLDAKAEFRARVKDSRVEVRIRVDSD